MVSDGYAVVGGGTGQDVEFINQVIFGLARVRITCLAPFRTDP